nr:uncharacterized mitochondrial protein AtMg00810-like [Tanacetum cinerariifolium]
MYLTSSRPDIVHASCVCARYQAQPTEKHFKEVKRIFRYLWGTVNMGLWYTKDSGFELTGFSDTDYAEVKTPSRVLSVEHNFLAKTHELVLKETRLYIAVNRGIRILTMEILLEPRSSKLLVGEMGDSIWIELVTLDINLGPE